MKTFSSLLLVVFLVATSGCCLMKKDGGSCANGLCEESKADAPSQPALPKKK